MKVIIGTSIVPTTTLIIFLFVELGILLTSFPQFVYAQTAENEIIENALESAIDSSTVIINIDEININNSKLIDVAFILIFNNLPILINIYSYN